MASTKILIPDMGDFKDVEVIEVLVKEGQQIKKNESLITLESDKSSVEVPSTHEGVVEKINIISFTSIIVSPLGMTISSFLIIEPKQIDLGNLILDLVLHPHYNT